MAQNITRKELEDWISLTSKNFKFKIPDGFVLIIDLIFNQVKGIEQLVIEKRFQQLLLTTNEKWNEIYGWGGYPTLSKWIEILVGERPLTDEEKAKKISDYEKQMRLYAAEICSVWLDDKYCNLENAFVGRYKDQNNIHLKKMIDEFLSIKEDLSYPRIKRMGLHLRTHLIADKKAFFNKMLDITTKQNPIPYKLEDKPKQNSRALPLPTLKKI